MCDRRRLQRSPNGDRTQPGQEQHWQETPAVLQEPVEEAVEELPNNSGPGQGLMIIL